MTDLTLKSAIELAESAPRFHEFADSMPHVIWTARPDGMVDFLNRAYTTITSISLDVDSQNWIDGLHPDDVDRVLAVWKDAITTGHDYNVEFRVFNVQLREYRWFAVAANPIRDPSGAITKWYGFCIDVHDSRVAMKQAAAAAERLNSTLEAISDCFILVDQEWRMVYINKAAEQEIGQPRSSFLMQRIWDAFHQETGSKFYLECYKAVENGQPAEFEYFSAVLHQWYEFGLYPVEDGLSIYFRNIDNRKKAEQEIQRLAFYDQLTGLPNRQLLYDRLEHAHLVSMRNKCYSAVLFIDLDNFKSLNDTQGHMQGDLLLQSTARRLTECVRKSDTVARLGGDEFVVVLENLAGTELEAAKQAELIAEKIQAALNAPHQLDGIRHISTPSIGVTVFCAETEQIGESLKRADMAMYQAKAAGRNAIRFYDPAMQEAINRKLTLEAALRDSLEHNQFVLYYQPQLDSRQRLVGAEGLLRWTHPVYSTTPPSVFIPLAEEAGLIEAIGKWVLQAACTQLAAWALDSKTADLILSINVSAYEFRLPGFVEQVLKVVQDTGVNPERLKLELTETVMVENIKDAIAKMDALKAHGIRFSLDDFGTGYSSLSYLRDLPLEQVKIDRSFINRVPGNGSDTAIVQAIIAMGHSLGFTIVAEGVEKEEQLEFLQKQDCNTYQGYLFSAPLPPEEFARYINNHNDLAVSHHEKLL